MKRTGLFLTILLAIASFTVGFAMRFYSILNVTVEEVKQSINYDERHGTLNVLVLGIDEVEAVNRTDTIILARIDLDRKTASVMSIPRDTRVHIKGRKNQEKINHAYVYGGIDLLRETVVNLTGVPINYYLTLNYASFPKIVDAIGGVEIDVEKRMSYNDRAQGLHINFREGKQLLNGEQALNYVRFRHDAMGDMGRMARQQKFARAFMAKVCTPAILPRLPELVELTLNEIKTDLPVKNALQLAMQLKDIKLEDVRFFTVPGSAAMINKISYFVPDLQRMSELMDPNYVRENASNNASNNASSNASNAGQSSGEGTASSSGNSGNSVNSEAKVDLPAVTVREPIGILNGTGSAGLAKQVAGIFEKAGMEVAYIGNARHNDYRYCVVQYPEKGTSKTAHDLAKLCGISESLVRKASVAQPAVLILGKNNYEQVMNRIRSLIP